MDNLLSIIKYISDYISTNHELDIGVFFIVCIISFVPFYVGYYIITYGTTRKITKRDFLNVVIKSKIIWNARAIMGFSIHLIGRMMPYLYIVFWGKDLPFWIFMLMGIVVFISILFFILKLIPKKHELPRNLEIISHDVIETLEDRQILWQIYDDTFRALNKESPCKQSFDKDHFDSILGDYRVKKYILRKKEGEILGVAIVANDFENLPWISEDYFKENFPEEYNNKLIYYFAGLAIKDEYRGNKYSLSLLEYIVNDLPRGIIMGFDHSRNINPTLHYFTRIIKQSRLIKRTHIEQQHYHVVNWKKKI